MAETLPAGLVEALRAALGGRVHPGEPLGRHTSFRIGGPAEVLVVPATGADLATLLRLTAAHGVRPNFLGGGSNLLVGDGGIPGVVVKLGRGFSHLAWSPRADGAAVRAGAAVQLGRLARAAEERGLAGLEFAEGIPGTVGGALFMNAGAYGGDVSATVEAVEGLNGSGEPVELGRAALSFGYRRSGLPAGVVVTAVRFALLADEPVRVQTRMAEARERRIAAQPHGRACADLFSRTL